MNIYGASGHGKVIIDILKASAIQIDYLIDDNPQICQVLGFKVVHEPSEDLLEIPSLLAVGNNLVRKQLAERFSGKIGQAVNHPTAVVSPTATIGEGTVVMPAAVINSGCRIGRHCIINSAAVVEHEVEIGDFAHISPNASITGNVTIGEGTHIGAGATVIPGVKVGKWVQIGAGAIIIRDIPDFAVVVGNPGKIIKYANE